MSSVKSLIKKPSLLSNFSISDRDEEKVIEEVLTTPYEKVIKILMNLKKYLEFNKSNSIIINDLSWVIDRIQSHSLYTYDMTDNSAELQKYSKKSHEVKSFLDYLNNYSETKDIQRRNKEAKFQTVKETAKFDFQGKKLSSRNHLISSPSYLTSRQDSALNTINNLKSIEYDETDKSPVAKVNFQSTEFNPFNIDAIKIIPSYDIDKVLDKDFDIFNFELAVGRENTLVLGSKAIIEHLDIDLYLNTQHLDNFLRQVKDRYYVTSPYHNDLHGLDVCLTVGTYLTYSGLIQTLYLSELDIAAMLIGSLVHDMAHPGLTNMFQINSYSDLALVYNDISVLENYHISETFKILKKPDCNIFSKQSREDFKVIRRRIIESILATDMTHHAKINTTIKNKLQLKNISKANNNANTIVDTASKTFFDDQQEIINFLVHTADLSHNSKNFDISYKWTYMLMDEFWKQGDKEKEMDLPVSFLCDRNNVDVPKSQIGFIKGIIIPTFDILVDILPGLIFYRENVDKNLDAWGKIILEESKELAKK